MPEPTAPGSPIRPPGGAQPAARPSTQLPGNPSPAGQPGPSNGIRPNVPAGMVARTSVGAAAPARPSAVSTLPARPGLGPQPGASGLTSRLVPQAAQSGAPVQQSAAPRPLVQPAPVANGPSAGVARGAPASGASRPPAQAPLAPRTIVSHVGGPLPLRPTGPPPAQAGPGARPLMRPPMGQALPNTSGGPQPGAGPQPGVGQPGGGAVRPPGGALSSRPGALSAGPSMPPPRPPGSAPMGFGAGPPSSFGAPAGPMGPPLGTGQPPPLRGPPGSLQQSSAALPSLGGPRPPGGPPSFGAPPLPGGPPVSGLPPSYGGPPLPGGPPIPGAAPPPFGGPPMPGGPPFPGAVGMRPPPPLQPPTFGAARQVAQDVGAAPPAGAGDGSGSHTASVGSRIDPTQIPRPAMPVLPEVFCTRQDGKHVIPPPSTSHVVVQDTGNCPPRCMRSTMHQVPTTGDLMRMSNMPLALIVQPLAAPGPGDSPVEVVDMGPGGPVRCSSSECKAYMNPHMQFIEGGRKFRCNFCGAVTDTPYDYIEHVGPDGRRRDADERPELRNGTVEFVASAEYMVRDPMLPTHLFILDSSYAAVSSGFLASACAAIVQTLDQIQGGERVHVGIATFDSSIQFYSIAAGQGGASMMVVPEVDHPFCPQPTSVVVRLAKSRDLVEALLKNIPRLFAGTQVSGNCGGAAIKAGVEALKVQTGGKLHVFLAGLPTLGAAPLSQRDQKVPAGDKDPQKLQEPESKDYKALAAEAAEYQVSIDLVVASPGYSDVATLRELCTVTGGQLYHYSPFAAGVDDDQLLNDLRWNLMRPQGWEAVGRLRCSAGLAVERYTGSFYRRTTTDLDFAALHCEHAFAVRLRYEEKLTDKQEVFFQFALLYSTCDGERRIRVHTLGLPTTAVLGSVFRGADLDAQLAWAARAAAAGVASAGSLAAARDSVQKATVDCLLSYRKNCATASSSGQLILPESLRLLPLYSNALMKSPAFWANTAPDVRAAWLAAYLTAPVDKVMPLIYPRLIPLHQLVQDPHPDAGIPEECKGLTAEKLDASGIYLLENGREAFIHFAPHPDPMALKLLLGVDSLDMLPKGAVGLPYLDNPVSRAVNDVLNLVRQERSAWMRMRLVRRGDPTEIAFFNLVVEDRCQTGMSYVEYLCAVHRLIQNKLA